MALSETMLKDCKNVIYNESKLPDNLKEPVYLAINHMIMLEYGYEDFLSREAAGEGVRINPLASLITIHGGDDKAFIDWFMTYEIPAEGENSPAWEG